MKITPTITEVLGRCHAMPVRLRYESVNGRLRLVQDDGTTFVQRNVMDDLARSGHVSKAVGPALDKPHVTEAVYRITALGLRAIGHRPARPEPRRRRRLPSTASMLLRSEPRPVAS